jgi:hypothetical protein
MKQMKRPFLSNSKAKSAAGTAGGGIKELINFRRIINAIVYFWTTLSTKGIFLFWLAGLFLIAVLMWGPTGGLRTESEIKTANRILQDAGEKRRIEKAISGWLLPGRATQAGNWYTLHDNNVAVIFTVPVDGIFVPFLATFNAENRIDGMYPLSRTAQRFLKRTPPNIFAIWTTRISAAAQLLNSVRR